MENGLYSPKTAPLRDVVSLFWQVNTCNTQYRSETIIPKGCVEIIFNFYDEPGLCATLGDHSFKIPRCFINGFHTHPIHIHLTGVQCFFGIVLHPTAVKAIFNIPAGEFANSCIDMTLVDALMYSLWHQLAEQDSFSQRIALFSGWVKKRMTTPTPHELAINNFLSIHTKCGSLLPSISDALCYSQRHLSRKLQELTGMNSEKTLLYKKYLYAIQLIHQSNMSLTEIAYAAHFSDQSHFVRSFKRFADMTPGQYSARKSNIVGHFFDNVR